MLEKRKDDSESIQKFQGMLMAAVIGALLLFIAPVLVVYITDSGIDGKTAEQALFTIPTSEGQSLPADFVEKVSAIFDLVLWVAKIIVVLFIVMAVIMLQMPRQTYAPVDPQKPPALISKPAVQQ